MPSAPKKKRPAPPPMGGGPPGMFPSEAAEQEPPHPYGQEGMEQEPPHMGMAPSMPGQAMDPLMAMMGGGGGMPPGPPPMPIGGIGALGGSGMVPPPDFPAGPGGLPYGGSLPTRAAAGDTIPTGNSPLIEALLQSLAGPSPEAGMSGMGLDQLLQLLALAQSGSGLPPSMGVPAGGSGVQADYGSPGLLQGLGVGGGGGGY